MNIQCHSVIETRKSDMVVVRKRRRNSIIVDINLPCGSRTSDEEKSGKIRFQKKNHEHLDHENFTCTCNYGKIRKHNEGIG